jgi:hypothetical protein
MRFRFGLRSLAVIVAAICIALWAVPATWDWCKWQLLRAVVVDTISQIAASPDKPAVYYGVAWHSEYCLANVEVKWDTSTGTAIPLSSTPRSGAIFVDMPGKVHTWANSSNEVMRLLRQND